MRTVIRKMGNSRGVLIPKPLLIQVGLTDIADMVVEKDAIVLRKPRKKVRRGWSEASRRLAAIDDDRSIWPEFSNENDTKLKW